MRQNGKTELLFPAMTHRAIGFGEGQILKYTAQNGYEARNKWLKIHLKRLLASPLSQLFTYRKGLNNEVMLFSNGSEWSPFSPTGKVAGDTLHMACIDEAWSRPDSVTELGIRPAMLTAGPVKQLWRASMVPGQSRLKKENKGRGVDPKYLRAAMRRGRAMVQAGVTRGTAYLEFGAPAGSDPADPATWWLCMPALGHTITEASVQADFDAPGTDLIDFEAEYLSWWPAETIPGWQTIKERTWRGLFDEFSSAEGLVAVAADCTDDRTLGYIGICGRRWDGDYHVEIIEPGQNIELGTLGVEWMYKRLREVIDKWEPLAIVIDPKGPANFLIPLLKRDGFKVHPDGPLMTPNINQVEAACGLLYDATGQEVPEFVPEDGADPPTRLHHIGQAELNRAVAGVRKLSSPTTGTFRWARVASAANTSPLQCVTLALLGYEVNKGDDYDVMKSVG